MANPNDALLHNILNQIDVALERWDELQVKKVSGRAYYEITTSTAQEVVTILAATINRLAHYGTQYRIELETILDSTVAWNKRPENNPESIDRLAGILRALRSDYQNGYLSTFQELIHADLFADFLEMASYFLDEGYKDPAAVMAGGVLEEHLRKLCLKNGLLIEDVKPTGNEPKKAGRLNDDLAGKQIYGKLDQKNVTAWLDLRNKAAHAKYGEYTKEQVELMVQGIRDFLTRNPA